MVFEDPIHEPSTNEKINLHVKSVLEALSLEKATHVGFTITGPGSITEPNVLTFSFINHGGVGMHVSIAFMAFEMSFFKEVARRVMMHSGIPVDS